jgi:hypothetical protein
MNGGEIGGNAVADGQPKLQPSPRKPLHEMTGREIVQLALWALEHGEDGIEDTGLDEFARIDDYREFHTGLEPKPPPQALAMNDAAASLTRLAT